MASDAGKSQGIRLADVLVLGPFMLYLAAKGRMSANDRLLLGGIGAATIFYNLHHYKRIAEETAAELQIQAPAEVVGVRG